MSDKEELDRIIYEAFEQQRKDNTTTIHLVSEDVFNAMKHRADSAENALIDIRQWLESGEQIGSSARQTLAAITVVITTYFKSAE